MKKVSIIIPTYNRFKYLMNTIDSIKGQTYKNIEIIVINDCSTQNEYYNYDYALNDIKIINLDKNTKDVFGYVCAAHVRNEGIKIATGNYIAFCDDDDIWLPHKLELQMKLMDDSDCKMCCTDGYIGVGEYNSNEKYSIHNSEYYYTTLQHIYKNNGSHLNGFPDICTLDFLKIHNCIICSSVVIEKTILDKINNFNTIKPPGEDYDCWLRALEHTNCLYIKSPCFYYDNGHGYGRHY